MARIFFRNIVLPLYSPPHPTGIPAECPIIGDKYRRAEEQLRYPSRTQKTRHNDVQQTMVTAVLWRQRLTFRTGIWQDKNSHETYRTWLCSVILASLFCLGVIVNLQLCGGIAWFSLQLPPRSRSRFRLKRKWVGLFTVQNHNFGQVVFVK